MGSVVKDVGASLFGGNITSLFIIHFHIMQPRSADLDVHMSRKGLGCVAGPLLYCAVASKRIASGCFDHAASRVIVRDSSVRQAGSLSSDHCLQRAKV